MIPEESILDRSWIVLVSIAKIDIGSIQDRFLANKLVEITHLTNV
jgi:hypothetical protein